MPHPMSNIAFRIMCLMHASRSKPEFTRPVLAEAGIAEGMRVLDFGTGSGAFTIAAARLVGPSGHVYAVDHQPLALTRVSRLADKSGLRSISTIHSDGRLAIDSGSIDVVLLYDVFHSLDNILSVLFELYRVLKRDGLLSFTDHHMRDEEIRLQMEASGLFVFVKRGEKTFSFRKTMTL
jgi:ubiquinone/menaquinone biosynthesis C-methylase UbiE